MLRASPNASISPNLYNSPKKGGYRECFIARPGHKNVGQDCSGQELRIAADYALEKVWLEAFRNKQDVHSIGAHMMFKEEWEAGALEDCAYFTKNKAKCNCPKHLEKRDKNGKDPHSMDAALMFPEVWAESTVSINKG